MLLHQKILKHVFRVICSQFHFVRTERCPVRNAMYLGLPKSIYFIFRWSVIVNNESLWISYIKKTLKHVYMVICPIPLWWTMYFLLECLYSLCHLLDICTHFFIRNFDRGWWLKYLGYPMQVLCTLTFHGERRYSNVPRQELV